MNKGITLPNWEFQPYTSTEMANLETLAPQTIIWPLYGTEIDQTHEKQLKSFLSWHDSVAISYRPYADNIPQRDPVDWADECARRVRAMHYLGDTICDNERNLAVEHGSEDWKAQASWLVRFASRWRKAAYPGGIHMGALSPSGNYLEGLKYFIDHKTYGYFDWADWHIYNEAQLEVAYEWAYKIRTPSTITEFNRIDPATVLNSRYTSPTGSRFSFLDAVWFILGGTDDQKAYDIGAPANAQYFQSFVRYTYSDPTKVIEVGPGVLELLKQNGDTALDSERYLKDSKDDVFGSVTEGKKGKYYWNKATGIVTFVANDKVLGQ